MKKNIHKHPYPFGITFILVMFMIGLLAGCEKNNENPGMDEFLNAFGNKDKLTSVIKKYALPEIVPDALQACDLEKPIIKKTEKKEGITYYSAEATVRDCEQTENAKGTIRMFTIGWKENKIVKFSWGGPKSGKVEY